MTTLNGQLIGRAERTTRAVLDVLLADTDTTFHQWVALNLTANGTTDVTAQMTAALRLDRSTMDEVLAELASAGLHANGELTAAGRARYARIATGVAEITARLYGGIPDEDMATAARVLAIVTERANAELVA